jgi:hypothetical protein
VIVCGTAHLSVTLLTERDRVVLLDLAEDSLRMQIAAFRAQLTHDVQERTDQVTCLIRRSARAPLRKTLVCGRCLRGPAPGSPRSGTGWTGALAPTEKDRRRQLSATDRLRWLAEAVFL